MVRDLKQLRTALKSKEREAETLRQQLQSAQQQLETASMKGEAQAGDAEALRAKYDSLHSELQRKDAELQEALRKLSTRNQRCVAPFLTPRCSCWHNQLPHAVDNVRGQLWRFRLDKQDAHQWWSYVWHLSKQQQQAMPSHITQPGSGDIETDKDIQLARCNNLLREQAMQLVLVSRLTRLSTETADTLSSPTCPACLRVTGSAATAGPKSRHQARGRALHREDGSAGQGNRTTSAPAQDAKGKRRDQAG